MAGIRGIYLAYAIDQVVTNAGQQNLHRLIDEFKHEVLATGHASWIFDPGDAFKVDPQAAVDPGIRTINRAALNNADVVVAFLPKGTASLGVPMEIDRAMDQGKHVILFHDATSWMLESERIHVIHNIDGAGMVQAMNLLDQMDPPQTTESRLDMPTIVWNDGCLPRRAYPEDAGLDLVTSQSVTILPGSFQDVPVGVSVELPEWSWGLVTGRSSALRKKGLLVHSGVIDAGYRGPLFAGAWNMTDEPVVVKAGERIAQLIVLNNSTRHVQPVKVDQLSQSDRGNNGFGSSGA